MVHGEESDFVQVRRLPQLLRELQHVAAVAGLQRLARNSQILLRCARGRIGGAAAPHDADGHPQRAAPHHVGDETELLAIPRIEEGARPLELLELENVLVGSREVDGLRHAVGPLDAHHVGFEVRPQAKVRDPPGDDARLVDRARANLDFGADTEGVVLATAGAEAHELDVHGQVRVPAVISQQVDAGRVRDEDVPVAVAVDVAHGDPRTRQPPR